MAALPALFVDIDKEPALALAKLRDFSLPPSAIVHSGNGLHAYWLLDLPTTDFAMADHILRGLARHFEADKTNIVQALRLPGTTNNKPNRTPSICRVIDLFPDSRYKLNDFAEFASPSNFSSKEQARYIRSVHHDHKLNTSLVNAVADCLLSHYRGYIKSNGYIAALCPCNHCHDYPGSHFNFDTSRAVGVCFGRHGHFLLKDLCPLLQIDLSAYGGFYA